MSDPLPPGTYYIEDLLYQRVVLAPQPNEDPNQPLNWSAWRKSLHMGLLCLYGLMVFATLCASQPLWSVFNAELNISYPMLNDGYALNTATLSVGCIFLIPIALRYGRRPMYLLTAAALLGIAIWQAVFHTATEYIIFSVLCGIPSALNEALFQVTISDLFFVHQRGTMNGLFLVASSAGVYLSPVAAGYIAANHSWRWVFWCCTIIFGIIFVLMLLAFEETKYTDIFLEGHAVNELEQPVNATRVTSTSKQPTDNADKTPQTPVTLDRASRASHLSMSIPMNSYWKRLSLWTSYKDVDSTSGSRSIWKHAYFPFVILVQFPAVTLAAVVYGFNMAVLSIITIVQTTLYPYPPYNFSTIGVGNMNMAPMAGLILGTLYGGPFVDWFIVQVSKKRKGIYEPETRLWLSIFPSLLSLAGILMFGLTIDKGLPWPINAVGAGFVGFGLGGTGDIVLTYCQDSYQNVLGDALTGVVFVRNIITTVLVFVIAPWMENMGIYNMFVLLGCISIVVSASCIPFFFLGRKWRAQLAPKYDHYTALQY